MPRLLIFASVPRYALVFAVLLLAVPANANTLVLADQSNAYLHVVVVASDGVSSDADDAYLAPFVGSVDATAQGVLDPELLVASIIIEVPETSVDFSFGSAQVPARLTVSAYYEWAPSDQAILLGGSGTIYTGQLADFALTGTLEAFGETTPVDFNLSNYTGSTKLHRALGGSHPLAFAPNPSTLILGEPGGGVVEIDNDFAGFIGSMGGVDFWINPARLYFDSVTFVPEPSTAILLAAGLAGFAAARRRR